VCLEVFVLSTNVRKENYLASNFLRKMRPITLERTVTGFIMTVDDVLKEQVSIKEEKRNKFKKKSEE